MNPEDDPEKRIQQLERPLTEQAHTSELGTTVPPGSWSPPPPPPPPYYGDPAGTPAGPGIPAGAQPVPSAGPGSTPGAPLYLPPEAVGRLSGDDAFGQRPAGDPSGHRPAGDDPFGQPAGDDTRRLPPYEPQSSDNTAVLPPASREEPPAEPDDRAAAEPDDRAVPSAPADETAPTREFPQPPDEEQDGLIDDAELPRRGD